ncbi:small ubiquitin-related modifier 1-like [Panicum miliaceum]|uniref:Small ubiquitin-related modifier 1-like n=1 Tax=Panicum miliaceum TaxID=4540 RepID=A0A3L6SPB7_PANMI|nr:small ubiquitin-related modifier 1-like [Panicum miliaceum]
MPPSSSPANAGPGVEEEARGTATAPVKSEAGADGSLINVKVQSQIAEDVFFRIKRNVELRRLIDMYCGKHSLDPKAVRLLDPSGRFIRTAQTPDEVGLEDGDAIDLVLDQEGGGGAPVPASQQSSA